MSLASHLADGALGHWMQSRVGTSVVTDRLGDALHRRIPLRPPRRAPAGHSGLVQAVVRARLGLAVQHAPPYAALAGAHRLGLAPAAALHAHAARFPSHAGLDAGRRRAALRWRPVGGDWRDIGDPFGATRPTERRPDRTRPDLEVLRDRLDASAPPGRLADRAGELELASLCEITAGWSVGLARLAEDRSGRVDEACDLVALASQTGLLSHLRILAGGPPCGVALGVTDAVVVPRWAHGGTVVGDLLLDVVSIADPLRRIDQVLRHVDHLLARAWLDGPEGYGITTVGLYFARHGALATWRVEEIASGRDEFLDLATRAAVADGARTTTMRELRCRYDVPRS